MVKDGWKEWQTLPDGVMLYLDFKFSDQLFLDTFQYEVRHTTENGAEHHGLRYGPSYGDFPKTVRVYYPLLKVQYPIHQHQSCKEELCVAVDASRYKTEPPEDDDEVDLSTDDESYEPE
jgi:hypothetical protein